VESLAGYGHRRWIPDQVRDDEKYERRWIPDQVRDDEKYERRWVPDQVRDDGNTRDTGSRIRFGTAA